MYPITTRSDIPNEVDAYYQRTLLKAGQGLLVHTKFGQVSTIPSNSGSQTARWRRYENLAKKKTPLVAGQTPVGSKLVSTEVTVTTKEYGDFVLIDNNLLVTSMDPVLTVITEKQGRQGAETIDSLVCDVLNAGTNIIYSGSATQRSDVTVAFAYTDVDDAVVNLKNYHAEKITSMVDATNLVGTQPIPPCYVGIIHINATSLVRAITANGGFIPVEKYASRITPFEGEIGTYGQVRFIETSEAKYWPLTGGGNNSKDVYSLIILGADAYGITSLAGEGMKSYRFGLGSAGTADPIAQRATSGWRANHASVILNEEFMLRYEFTLA